MNINQIIRILLVLNIICLLVIGCEPQNDSMTPEESDYYEKFVNKVSLLDMTEASLKNLKDIDYAPNPQFTINEITYCGYNFRDRIKLHLSNLKNATPPKLFEELHELNISLWENYLVLGEKIGSIMYRWGKVIQNAPKDEYGIPIRTSRMVREFNKTQKQFESILITCDASSGTYSYRADKILNEINNQLNERVGHKKLSEMARLRFDRLKLPEISIAFKPAIIPAKIEINNHADIEISSEYNIPVFFGTFSIRAATKIQEIKKN